MSDISKSMADYLQTPGQTTLEAYVIANQSDSSPDIKLDIEEAWIETKAQRTTNIQTSRVSAALLKAGGKKAVNLLKKAPPNSDETPAHFPAHVSIEADCNPVQPAGPSSTGISDAVASPPTEPAANTSTAETNDTADSHNTNITNDNVVSSNNVEEENTEKLLLVLTEDGFKSTIPINDDTPECFKHFRQFQEESFKMVKEKELFVYQQGFLPNTLFVDNIVLLKTTHAYPQINVSMINEVHSLCLQWACLINPMLNQKK